jgi:hypothetical protein
MPYCLLGHGFLTGTNHSVDDLDEEPALHRR